jgi:hypothetical protein
MPGSDPVRSENLSPHRIPALMLRTKTRFRNPCTLDTCLQTLIHLPSGITLGLSFPQKGDPFKNKALKL